MKKRIKMEHDIHHTTSESLLFLGLRKSALLRLIIRAEEGDLLLGLDLSGIKNETLKKSLSFNGFRRHDEVWKDSNTILNGLRMIFFQNQFWSFPFTFTT